jgi:hypothetical protein
MTRLRILLFAALLFGALCATSPCFAADAPKPQQKIVYLLKDGGSQTLQGDQDWGWQNRDALPVLLGNGWRITRIDMTASAAVNPDQVLAIVLLEK